MVLPFTGTLPLSAIEDEFGGVPPTNLSEYYRGGGGLTSGNNTNVPEAGALSVSDFYGGEALLTMYEQVLTGSGTFTPLYAGVRAIIQIGGGGGSAGCSVSNNGEDYSIYGYGSFVAPSGAGDSIFVTDISAFANGTYGVGVGGAAYTLVPRGMSAISGKDGTASYLRSPFNTPYNINAGFGGGGRYQQSSGERPSYPMSGTYPSGSSGLPTTVIFNEVSIDPASYMNITSGGVGSRGSYKMDAPSNSVPAGGNGFLRIYYFVGT